MFIDVNAYAGHWPFRNLRNNTVQAAADNAERHGITHVLLTGLDAIFYKDPTPGNLAFADEVRACKSPVKLLPFAVINPTYPAWERAMARAVEEQGFCGIELCPLYHNYPFQGQSTGYGWVNPAGEALALAGSLGVPVRINASFENFRQRHWMDVQNTALDGDALCQLLSAHPETAVILCGTIPCSLGDKMQALVKERSNILFDFAVYDGFCSSAAKMTLDWMDPSHLCFGTLSPFYYPEPAMVKLRYVPEFSHPGIPADNVAPYLKGLA